MASGLQRGCTQMLISGIMTATAKSKTFNTSIKDKPFDQTMGVNLVSETYPYPWIELPNDEELADDSRNTCYYDWVRVYKLVDINKP